MSYANICPRCKAKDSLRVAYSEHVEYAIASIPEDPSDYVEVDEETHNMYDAEVIHVCCSKCNKYWYNLHELGEELRATGVKVKPETPARTDLPAGMRGEED